MTLEQETPLRSGTTAEWAAGPVLDVGEVGVNLTTGEYKVGDGATTFPLLRSLTPVVIPVVLVAGTKVTADARIRAASTIVPVHKTLGTVTAAKVLTVARSNGVSFTVTSTDATDTSTLDVLVWY